MMFQRLGACYTENTNTMRYALLLVVLAIRPIAQAEVEILSIEVLRETPDEVDLELKYRLSGTRENTRAGAMTMFRGRSTGHWAYRSAKLEPGTHRAVITIGRNADAPGDLFLRQLRHHHRRRRPSQASLRLREGLVRRSRHVRPGGASRIEARRRSAARRALDDGAALDTHHGGRGSESARRRCEAGAAPRPCEPTPRRRRPGPSHDASGDRGARRPRPRPDYTARESHGRPAPRRLA